MSSINLLTYRHFIKISKEATVILSFIGTFIYSLTDYPFAFNFETYEHGNYTIAFTIAIATVIWSLLSIFDDDDSSILIIIPPFFHLYWIDSGNEYASVLAAFVVHFFLLKSLSLHRLKQIMYIVLFLYLIQFVYTAYHLYIGEMSDKLSFYNTGVFAIYSIVFIPLCQYLASKNLSGGYYKLLFSLYVIAILLIIFFVKSRTAMIAVFLAFCFPVLFNWIKRQSIYVKVSLLFAFSLLFLYLLNYLFHIKEDSSIGRVLMLDIAFSNVKEYWFSGVGLGNFTWYYPQWQADYFSIVTSPDLGYFLNAGESYVIFNEFVQLFLSIGAPLFVLLCYLIVRFFYFRIPAIPAEIDLLKMIKTTFTIILACSLTYYTLHINVVLLITAYYAAISWKILEKGRFLLAGKISFSKQLILISCFVALFFVYQKYEAIHNWVDIKNPPYVSITDGKSEISSILSQLKNDGKFLAEYGNYIYEHHGDIEKAIILIEKAKRNFISKESIENLAYLYVEEGNYEKAIENFEWLVNYIPSKFSNRLELLKLYQKNLNLDKAKHLAKYTLNMPIKIPSKEVDFIKNEIARISKDLDKNMTDCEYGHR